MTFSPGAYLAVQSVILEPPGSFKAVISAYGMLDMKAPWFSTHFEKHPLGRPMLPASLIDNHLAAITPGTVVSAVMPPARVDLALATVQYGRFPEMLGEDRAVYPMESLESAKDHFPPLFIYHGLEDSAVEVKQTQAFVDRLRQVSPEAKLLVRFEHGDHGFDAKVVGLEAPWLKEGLDFVRPEWLG